VEDHEDTGAVFRDYLQALGHQAVVVRTAEVALGRLQVEAPDAILLDLSLPGMSGLDFLRLRPVQESGLPIVTVSGTASEPDIRESLRLGALDFLNKPVALERLQQVMALLAPRTDRRPRGASPRRERRRGPRVAVSFPVRLRPYTGTEGPGTATELSAFGVKVRTAVSLEHGAAVTLVFSPEGGPVLEAVGLLLRVDTDGTVFSFVDLSPDAFERLRRFVESRAQ
jgi:DNA-binding response OmpR family regulator